MKIVINRCWGGYGLSGLILNELGNNAEDLPRNDPKLIAAIEKIGKDANDNFANLKIVEIPDGSFWKIEDYDGMEHVIYSMSEIKEVS